MSALPALPSGLTVEDRKRIRSTSEDCEDKTKEERGHDLRRM